MLQSLSPGLVKTEMPPTDFLNSCPFLNPEDIADGVLYVLGTPPHVQVCWIINKFILVYR
jgi:NADP+-dependent farnesol dehydrogenase